MFSLPRILIVDSNAQKPPAFTKAALTKVTYNPL